MRIAYVSLHWPRTLHSGVGKKIQAQVQSWTEMGHDVRLFMHTSFHTPMSDLLPAECFFYLPDAGLKTEVDRVRAAQQMVRAVEAFQPDTIYLRYGIYVYPVHRLLHIAPVIEEINTNDLTQHDGLGGLYSFYNQLTRGFLLRNVHGLVTVSHELACSSAFTAYGRPTLVIANNIDLQKFTRLPAPSNEIPRLAFIGNPGFPWHGVDKLVTLAKLIPDIHLDIIGYQELAGFGPLPENISLHGYLKVQDYQKLLASADVAISSLALHRVGLHEASPLKSRECLAFGLPLIVAYQDTDLDDLDLEFILKIPNHEENIQTHARGIRDFAYRMRGYRVERKHLASIDQTAKESERIRFMEQLLHFNSTSSGAG